MPSPQDKTSVRNLASTDRFDVSGMDSTPRSASPTALVTTAMKESRVLMLGDTDHFNGHITAFSLSPATLKAAKEGGATHIAIEIDKGLQWKADKYMAGETSRESLTTSIQRMYAGQQNNEDGSFTRKIVDTVDFAKDNDMKILFADPHNGWGMKPGGLTPEEEKAWELENNRDRFEDTELVERLNDVLENDKNAKIYLAYGDAHLSVDNGNKDDINGPVTKMSVYSSRANMDSFEEEMQDPNTYGRQMGWMDVKPDLVYFMNDNTFSTTTATPDNLRNAVNNIGSTNDHRMTNTPSFTSSAAEYGLDDDNNRKLTSETAFNRAASGEADAPNQDRELIATPALQQKAVQNTPSYLSNGTNGP